MSTWFTIDKRAQFQTHNLKVNRLKNLTSEVMLREEDRTSLQPTM